MTIDRDQDRWDQAKLLCKENGSTSMIKKQFIPEVRKLLTKRH